MGASPAENLARSPGPLIGCLDQHEGVAERAVVRYGRCDQLERIGLRERVRPCHHEVVTDSTRGMGVPEFWVRDGERLHRLRVLRAEQLDLLWTSMPLWSTK